MAQLTLAEIMLRTLEVEYEVHITLHRDTGDVTYGPIMTTLDDTRVQSLASWAAANGLLASSEFDTVRIIDSVSGDPTLYLDLHGSQTVLGGSYGMGVITPIAPVEVVIPGIVVERDSPLPAFLVGGVVGALVATRQDTGDQQATTRRV